MMNPLQGISNVTDDQKAKAQAIMQGVRPQMQGLRDMEPDERRTKMQAIMKDTQAKIRAILTPDQQKEFDARAAQMMNRRKQGGGGNGDAPPPPPPQN